MAEVDVQADRLVATLRGYGSCVVAYSGGVDSAVVARAAHAALQDKAVAVTGVGPAVSPEELEHARRTAADIGIAHVELPTHEMQRNDYVANAPDRCFHCKTELYSVLGEYAKAHGFQTIANGTLLDDLGDYRPGLAAAEQASVRSPLVECQLDKRAVRSLAMHWSLNVWNKPASPCLASRIAYGQEVTPERLRMVDAAESLLRNEGIRECRVRYHEGDLARVEVPLEDLATIVEQPLRDRLQHELSALGFRHVAIDLAGFRSGSLNIGLPVVL